MKFEKRGKFGGARPGVEGEVNFSELARPPVDRPIGDHEGEKCEGNHARKKVPKRFEAIVVKFR